MIYMATTTSIYWYWLRSWQLTLTVVCGAQNRPSFVCGQWQRYSSYKYNALKCSCVLCVSYYRHFLLESYMVTAAHKFEFRLIQTKHLTKSDQWKEGHAVIQTRVFDRISMFSAYSRRECYGTLLTIYISTAFFCVKDSTSCGIDCHPITRRCTFWGKYITTKWTTNVKTRLIL
jgi:hypothetical protein